MAQTLDRSKLWEIQTPQVQPLCKRHATLWIIRTAVTPQVVRPAVLKEGFRKVAEEGWEVTDDVSIIERMGKPVKLTMGE